MAFLTFKGGVHPYDGKELSKEKPVREYLPGKEMVYPLSQHIGAPAQPVVKKGDYVLVGQKIAEMGGFVSAPIHSSVSGVVKELKKVRNNVGAMVDAIVIENDEKYETVEFTSVQSLKDCLMRQPLRKSVLRALSIPVFPESARPKDQLLLRFYF